MSILLSLIISGTFSIVAMDPETEEFGIGVASKVLDVGYIVPWIEAEAGAVATQALANPYLGKWAIELLKEGKNAEEVLKIIIEKDTSPEDRQIGIVDRYGNSISFTGKNNIQWAGHKNDKYVAIQGNILKGPEVIDTMFKVFKNTEGLPLAERLLLALEAGEAAGGDRRGKQSAALYVIRKRGGYQGANDKLVELKVVDNPEPLKELRREYELWQYAFLSVSYLRLAKEEKDKEEIFLKRAYSLLKKALESNLNNADVYNELAWEFALMKKYPQETIAQVLKDNPTMKVEIGGHADERGTRAYNYRLTDARANSVRTYFITKHGIDARRLIAIGYGEDRPVVPNAKTEEEHQLNRRVEFKILGEIK